MRSINKFSLSDIDSKTQQSFLVLDNQALNIFIDGLILEAQFELSDGSFLIWLSDNSPYDEGLHIYLMDPDHTIIDAIEAGSDFNPGILKIKEIGEKRIDFEFFTNEVTYQLEILKKSKIQLTLPLGWRYKKLLKRHMLIVNEIKKDGV